jgi:hypothetical protein
LHELRKQYERQPRGRSDDAIGKGLAVHGEKARRSEPPSKRGCAGSVWRRADRCNDR